MVAGLAGYPIQSITWLIKARAGSPCPWIRQCTSLPVPAAASHAMQAHLRRLFIP